MNFKYIFILLQVIMIGKNLKAQAPGDVVLHWSVAAELMNGSSAALGFAGMVGGVSNDALIIAGGANFPDKLPFQGGKKHFSDSIFILERINDSFYWNKKNKTKLAEPIAYAGHTATPGGIVYIGGENEKGISSKAYVLSWNKRTQQVEKASLPDLPAAVTAAGVASVGNIVYIAGGDEAVNSSGKFFYINITAKKPEWQRLPDIPVPLANAALVAVKKKLFLIGGRTKTPAGISRLHSSVYYFDLDKNKWYNAANISDGNYNTPFTATAAFNIGDENIVLAGGDKGDVFHRIENYLYQMAHTASDKQKAQLLAEKNQLILHHQGFSTDVLLYNIQNNAWSKIAGMPYAAQVTTSAVPWGKDLFICSGEIRPGVRSPKIIRIQLEKQQHNAK